MDYQQEISYIIYMNIYKLQQSPLKMLQPPSHELILPGAASSLCIGALELSQIQLRLVSPQTSLSFSAVGPPPPSSRRNAHETRPRKACRSEWATFSTTASSWSGDRRGLFLSPTPPSSVSAWIITTYYVLYIQGFATTWSNKAETVKMLFIYSDLHLNLTEFSGWSDGDGAGAASFLDRRLD